MTESYLVEFHKGSFLALKSAKMVAKSDIDKYNDYSYDVLKLQSLVMFYFTFWARLFDIGNVIPGFKTKKYLYYGLFISIPSLLHTLYAGQIFNSKIEILDKKYTKMFLDYQSKNVKS